ncbi:MAG: peptide deformylase [Clostridia bacterium]|nr:peptide deformylase [Clostridia bacterium]
MAIRIIRKKDDEVLSKVCKPVTVFDKKLGILLDDMYDTMKMYEGVGLAASQVGILKRVVVIDAGTGRVELINPEIIEESGVQNGLEGCLSVPGVYGEVERPNKVTVRALDRNGVPFEITGEELLARALCHEIDHLNGKLFLERATRLETSQKGQEKV